LLQFFHGVENPRFGPLRERLAHVSKTLRHVVPEKVEQRLNSPMQLVLVHDFLSFLLVLQTARLGLSTRSPHIGVAGVQIRFRDGGHVFACIPASGVDRFCEVCDLGRLPGKNAEGSVIFQTGRRLWIMCPVATRRGTQATRGP
jgi:hypothetical protein